MNLNLSIIVGSVLAFYVIYISIPPEYLKGNNSIYFFMAWLFVNLYIYYAFYSRLTGIYL
jgi:hypothetical protein